MSFLTHPKILVRKELYDMSRLNPPMVENIIAAQTHLNQLTIPFSMNRSVGWEDFETV